jgi:putative PIN family toxin of toxin-antitoxin system
MSREPSQRFELSNVPRVVLDTNTIISGMIAPTGAPAAVLRAWLANKFVLVTSPALIDEFTLVARRPHLQEKYGLTDDRIKEMAFLLWARAMVTPGNFEVKAVEADPDDDKFLACALEGQAEYIVSGDRHLLNLKEYQRVRMVAASDLLRTLETEASERI